MASFNLETAREKYRGFIDSTRRGACEFSLTINAEYTPFARCFAIFGYHLLGCELDDCSDSMASSIVYALRLYREQKIDCGCHLEIDKPYLQLLTFSLSALSIIDKLDEYSLEDHVIPIVSKDIKCDIDRSGALIGKARSGNQAMFIGILLLYARDNLGMNTQQAIDRWVELHLDSINTFGFWGNTKSMSHLQFQNGFHQYELLEYLHADAVPWRRAADSVASLGDGDGHFAPYPGGGGCYDYDAVFLLTTTAANVKRHKDLLCLTAKTLLAEQNADGGFCESKYVRPRSLGNILKSLNHVLAGRDRARTERLRQMVTLLRPQHDRIHTHWSIYSRGWGESDLWDSWFRMLTIARIDVAFNPEHAVNWGFIDFPGIGYHPSLHKQ